MYLGDCYYYSPKIIDLLVNICCFIYSGGKDSCYNMLQCVENGHEIVALAHLKPKQGILTYLQNLFGSITFAIINKRKHW